MARQGWTGMVRPGGRGGGRGHGGGRRHLGVDRAGRAERRRAGGAVPGRRAEAGGHVRGHRPRLRPGRARGQHHHRRRPGPGVDPAGAPIAARQRREGDLLHGRTQAKAHQDLVRQVVADGHPGCATTPWRTTPPWTPSPRPIRRSRSRTRNGRITKASGACVRCTTGPRARVHPVQPKLAAPARDACPWAGTSTRRTSSGRAARRSSPPSSASWPTGPRSSSTTRAVTAPRRWRRCAPCCPG